MRKSIWVAIGRRLAIAGLFVSYFFTCRWMVANFWTSEFPFYLRLVLIYSLAFFALLVPYRPLDPDLPKRILAAIIIIFGLIFFPVVSLAKQLGVNQVHLQYLIGAIAGGIWVQFIYSILEKPSKRERRSDRPRDYVRYH